MQTTAAAVLEFRLSEPRRPRAFNSNGGGNDVVCSAERAPLRPALFDRSAGSVNPATNSGGCPAREYSRTGDSRRQVGEIMAAVSSPDPQTLAGADGRRSTPTPNAAGAKSDSADPLSSVGPAPRLDHGYRQLGQAVTNSHSPDGLADTPEAASQSPRPAVSGSYSPWATRPSTNSLRSTYP